MRKLGVVSFVLLLCSPALLSVAGSQYEAEYELLDKRISLNLEDADAQEVFQTFARLLKAELGHQYDPQDTVSLLLDNVKVRTCLNAFCESAGCDWDLGPVDAPVLNFYSAGKVLEEKRAIATEMRISLDLKEASAGNVFRMFSEILKTELAVDLPIEGRVVTIKRADETISELLNEVCRGLGCRWRLVGDGPITLTVTPVRG